jgi:DNA-directed RNA polymerase subunit omega
VRGGKRGARTGANQNARKAFARERVDGIDRAARDWASRFAFPVFRIGNSASAWVAGALRPGSRAAGGFPIMRDDYVRAAALVITDPNVLINVVSRRVKQLRRGNRPLVESLEKLSAEDTALREIMEGKISYELATPAEIAAHR